MYLNYTAKPLSGDDLINHQRNVLNGIVQLLPSEHATSSALGQVQVAEANRLLSAVGIPGIGHKVRAAIARWNYGAFYWDQTMANATQTLDRHGIDELLKMMETQSTMSHLTVSNWAIGQIFAGIYQKSSTQSQPKPICGFDIGCGTGSTAAAIASNIAALEKTRLQPQLALSLFDATPHFCDATLEWALHDDRVAAIGLQPVMHEAGSTKISEFGNLTVCCGDAIDLLYKNALSNITNAICLVTANYSFHRLAASAKRDLMRLFQSCPEVAFLVGDLKNNTSLVNRNYFNPGHNGALNPGNEWLEEDFADQGYSLVSLGSHIPSYLDPRIATRSRWEDQNNDGHLWIAYRGEFILNALDLKVFPDRGIQDTSPVLG